MAQTTELISRDVLFGNPERASPKISPDGKHLTWLAPDERDVLQVWLAGPDGGDARKLTNDPKRGIRGYFWTYDGRQLIYEQDADGDENFHLFAADIVTGNVRDLTAFQGVRAAMVALDPDLPDADPATVTRKQYDNVWKAIGWKLVKPSKKPADKEE